MSEIEVIGHCPLSQQELDRIMLGVFEGENPGKDYLISLLMVEDEEMKHYNKTYRGLGEATDILSFVTATVPVNEAETEKQKPREQLICDIIIDINQLIRQKGNETIEKEFRNVLIHGLLHLLGYDHTRLTDKEIMSNKEEYYQRILQGE